MKIVLFGLGKRWERERSAEGGDLQPGSGFRSQSLGDLPDDIGIHDGDVIVVDPDAPFVDGKTYVVQIGNEVTAKRIHLENDKLRLLGADGGFEIIAPQRVQSLGGVILSRQWQRH